MSGDPLTDVVRSLKLTGGVFLEGTLTAPWALRSKITEEDCQPFLPIPRTVIAFHVVTEGEMTVRLDDHEAQPARTGDVVFLPRNPWHTLASDARVPPTLGDDLVLPPGECGLATIRFGGGGARTRILCGFLASDATTGTILDSLPAFLVIRIPDLAVRRWLEASIAMAARELTAGRVSSPAVMSQLSQLLLVEALRAHVESGSVPSGWLAGMADPGIARALALIHESIADPRDLAELATEAGLSRSVFIQRFTDRVGVSPGRYILSQRMALAEALIETTSLSTAEIAYRVGYDSPEAFSRAFKRETGVAPSLRRGHRAMAEEDGSEENRGTLG
jgi:AraC-like DNA-binding protein